MNDAEPETVTLDTLAYGAAGGTEHFISVEDREQDLLVGFCRLRFPADPVRRELDGAALVRELHVYGSEVAIGESESATGANEESHQHQGHGSRLMERAEEIAREAGYEKLAVIAGIGAREYYREKLGYRQDGPYVSKRL